MRSCTSSSDEILVENHGETAEEADLENTCLLKERERDRGGSGKEGREEEKGAKKDRSLGHREDRFLFAEEELFCVPRVPLLSVECKHANILSIVTRRRRSFRPK